MKTTHEVTRELIKEGDKLFKEMLETLDRMLAKNAESIKILDNAILAKETSNAYFEGYKAGSQTFCPHPIDHVVSEHNEDDNFSVCTLCYKDMVDLEDRLVPTLNDTITEGLPF